MAVKKSGKYRTYRPRKSFFSKFKLPVIFGSSGVKAVKGFYKRNKPETMSLAGLGAKKLKTYTVIASIVLTTMVVGLFGTVIIFAYFSRELPNPTQLLERSFELSTRFYDRNDKLIYEVFGDKNRTLVKMEDVVPYVLMLRSPPKTRSFICIKVIHSAVWQELLGTLLLVRGFREAPH